MSTTKYYKNPSVKTRNDENHDTDRYDLPCFAWVHDFLSNAIEGYTFAYVEECDTVNRIQAILLPFHPGGRFVIEEAEEFFQIYDKDTHLSIHTQGAQVPQMAYPKILFEPSKLIYVSPIKELCRKLMSSSLEVSSQPLRSFISSYGVENCADLPISAPAFVLFNLRLRYFSQPKPFTYTFAGSVLLALNPYGPVTFENPAVSVLENKNRSAHELPAHPFSIAELSFRRLTTRHERQTIIVSGDSGAGKTETAKTLMRYLASRHCDLLISEQEQMKQFYQSMYQKLEEMNLILESFGNAATTLNLNSSRFGRLNILYFGNSLLKGAGVQTYLLERSRITHPNDGERNFHVFYYLVESENSELLSSLGLLECRNVCSILPNFSCHPVTSKLQNQQKHLNELEVSLRHHGFTQSDIFDIYSILAAILHLGNLSALPRLSYEILESDFSFKEAARLLGVQVESLATLVCFRTLCVLDETTPRPDNARLPLVHTVMRWLYCQLFDKVIVKKLNESCTSKEDYIAILDIFGFEALQENSLEQFLINLANEKLQYFFIHHLILAEQYKFSDQKIQWKAMPACTGIQVLRCLTGCAPDLSCLKQKGYISASRKGECAAVLPFLDDVGRLASSDLTQDIKSHEVLFWRKLESLKTLHNEVFYPLQKTNEEKTCFLIHHFGGDVVYNIKNWIQKDNDKMDSQVFTCLSTSSNPLIKGLAEGAASHLKSRGRFQPIAQRFLRELDVLLVELSTTDLSFIRCFLSNEKQKANMFHGACILKQMQQSGTLDLLRVYRSGYSFHKDYTVLYSALLKFLQVTALQNVSDPLYQFKLLRHPKLLTKIALLCFVPTQQHTQWELGATMLFARSTLSEALTQFTNASVSSKDVVPLLHFLQWNCPSLTQFSQTYHYVATQPWRSIIRPVSLFYIVFQKIRYTFLLQKFTLIPYRLSFLLWKKNISSNKSYPPCHPQKKPSNVWPTTQYISPWYLTWKHQIFALPHTTSLLFFDGEHVWLVSTDVVPRAERIHFYCPHVANPESLTALRSLKVTTTATSQNVLMINSPHSFVEEATLGLCQHQARPSLFCIITQSWLMLSFDLTYGPLHRRNTVKQLSPQMKSMTYSTFIERSRTLDMKLVLRKLCSKHQSFDFDSLKFLKLFFPDSTSESLIASLWIFRHRASDCAVQDQFFILIMDLSKNEDIRGLFYGKLPSLHHINDSIHSVGYKYWTIPFPRYMNLSIRPSYFSLLEYSKCLILPSNRGFLWFGAGFLKLFAWWDISPTFKKYFNIQLIWNSESYHIPSTPPWLLWISCGTVLIPQKLDRKPLTTRGIISRDTQNTSVRPEQVLLTTFQGCTVLLTLSNPHMFLSLDHIEYLEASKSSVGAVYLHTLSSHLNSTTVAQLTNKGVLQQLTFEKTPSIQVKIPKTFLLTTEMHPTLFNKRSLKLTCAHYHWNGRALLCSLADLLTGEIQIWCIDPYFQRQPQLHCAVSIRYPRHVQCRHSTRF